MRHVYMRGIMGLIWLAFLYSAYATWKKEKDSRGGR